MAQRWSGGDQHSRNAEVFSRMVLTGSRRRRWEVPLWIAVIAASMFLMGFLTGNASAAGDPCAKRYAASPTIINHGQLVPLHPVLASYTRCVRVPVPTP